VRCSFKRAGLERLARDGKLAPAQQGWLEDIRKPPRLIAA
jgi:hypothetical protein